MDLTQAAKAFPDFHAEIHWQLVDGDRVTTYKTRYGTHDGPFLGIAPTRAARAFESRFFFEGPPKKKYNSSESPSETSRQTKRLAGMDEITKEWFSSTRERYVGAVRFAFVLLAVLFGIQLTTFAEYLDTQTQLRRARGQAEEARALTGAMREVAAAADALQQTVTDTLKELLSRLVEELKGDFAALDAKVADLRGNGPLPSEPRRNLAMQQLNALGLQKPEIVFDNDLEVKIKEAPNIADVSRPLAAWVDGNIIRPRFA